VFGRLCVVRALPACLVALAVMVSGCGGPAGRAISGVAESFHRAVSAHNGAAACRLLAPSTAQEVAQVSDSRCAAGILTQELPPAGASVAVRRFGTQAQVRLRGDTVFLAEFAQGWRVVAAGCVPRPPRPYDCQVQN
jgi:hypothetical protein